MTLVKSKHYDLGHILVTDIGGLYIWQILFIIYIIHKQKILKFYDFTGFRCRSKHGAEQFLSKEYSNK